MPIGSSQLITPTPPSTNCPAKRGVFIATGNALSSCPQPMILDTQMTLALLQELLMTLRGNDANSYQPLQTLGIENPESDTVVETKSE